MSHISEVEDTAYHEAGHAVACLALQMQQFGATIIPSGMVSGAFFDDNDYCDYNQVTIQAIFNEERAKNCLIILYAGFAAAKRINLQANKLTASLDDEEASRILKLIVGKDNDASQLEAQYRAKTEALLNDHWQAVELTAKQLLIDKSLDSYELEYLFEIAMTDDEEVKAQYEQYKTTKAFMYKYVKGGVHVQD